MMQYMNETKRKVSLKLEMQLVIGSYSLYEVQTMVISILGVAMFVLRVMVFVFGVVVHQMRVLRVCVRDWNGIVGTPGHNWFVVSGGAKKRNRFSEKVSGGAVFFMLFVCG